MTPLSRLFDAPRAADTPVAFGREGERSVGDLRRDVAALAEALAPAAGRRVGLHCEDAYAFTVGLLAAARVGACTVLPPSRQPGALRRLAPEVSGFLLDGTDTPDKIEGRPCRHPIVSEGPDPGAAHVPAAPQRDARWVELFTSGTTGDGRAVAKAPRHLEDEVRVLEDRFGALLEPGTAVLATVSPQHLYGLLFRVLWPLAAGRPFLRSSLLHPEELLPYVRARGPRFALVTTPAWLRRLVETQGAGALGECRAAFSSGGPLAAELARRAAGLLGGAPWEIYGSTESGGVAVRQQIRGEEPWQTLSSVSVERDPQHGCLAVTSPFVSAGETRPGGRARCVLGDRVELLPPHGFRLLGRADRVVKIGDKRLALPEMEARLAAHPAVFEAALVVLEPAGEARVAAVVTPSPEGRALLEAMGRRGLAKELAEHLAPDFDRVLLPRAWRVAEALPRDAQGKMPAAALRALFEGPAPRPAPPGERRRPERLSLRRDARTLDALLRIPEDLAFLEGHFPTRPVVAGVVQLGFVVDALQELLGAAPRLRGLSGLKFRELLRPGQEVSLHLELSEDGERFAFRLCNVHAAERVFSEGRGRLEREA